MVRVLGACLEPMVLGANWARCLALGVLRAQALDA
jgi:hypothetical protein